MIRSLALLILALLAVTPGLAQPPESAPPADVRIALDTSAGRIVIAVHEDKAPVTAANFLRYVDQKRFDGTSFYRGVGAADYGFVQGGAQNDPGRILPPIKHEPTTQTGLTHDDGALSMARYAPGSATGDFFIVLGQMPAMDAHPEAPGDNQGFAVFAHVVEGMDVVKTILAAPKSPTAGEGVMKGQMLEQPVKILTARQMP
ncbi:peptidylprolyl isomerase [Sphingobium baderi]|jgi:peptidyl-prolyl cis-trans isomerase A (cyclophilin A)|uniref:peptidylprolyl isomerase n=1 Tax=Sphingobium baderi TaxID=1332080 RepID=A0A0S3F3K2_9SPHN|nr:peptidylprolyl isomerase [Sphingobium baderi]ALR22256.1 peptidylprolyl isomerase [Sphingobium baderi]